MTGRTRSCALWIISVVVVLGILAALGLFFIYSGIYNVAAVYPDRPFVARVLSTIMEHSVRRHAAGIKVPPLDDPAMIRAGFDHYKDDCVVCHGAPGVKTGEMGRGLNPKPPKLTKAAGAWKPNELFWITKNGVRMTGMPAWDVVDRDGELWKTVAFVKKLPSMTPAEYQALRRRSPPVERR